MPEEWASIKRTLVQRLLVQPVGKVVGELCVAQVSEGEVGVVRDADGGQVVAFGFAAVFVHHVHSLPSQRRFVAPELEGGKSFYRVSIVECFDVKGNRACRSPGNSIR